MKTPWGGSRNPCLQVQALRPQLSFNLLACCPVSGLSTVVLHQWELSPAPGGLAASAGTQPQLTQKVTAKSVSKSFKTKRHSYIMKNLLPFHHQKEK